jgi:hypothetical protein
MANLKRLMKAHLRMPFPESVEKGEEYGDVNSVLIGADIYGWALLASRRQLSTDDASKLRSARDELAHSLDQFPPQARNYYESIMDLASAALDEVK